MLKKTKKMEYIFTKSSVITLVTEHSLSIDYVEDNFKEIVPDYKIAYQYNKDFEKLRDDKITNIENPEIILVLLHKYGIDFYYKKMLEYIIWQILKKKYTPTNLCHNIIQDIINYNNDFSRILKFLINKEISFELSCEDFFFSLPLLNLSPYKSNKYTSPSIAIKYGLGDVVEYLITNDMCKKKDICNIATTYNQFDILKIARKLGCPWDSKIYEIATEMGNFNIIKWAHLQGCPFGDNICLKAAMYDNFEILKWAHKKGCKLDRNIYTYATANNNFEIIKWAYELGLPLSDVICANAALCGNLNILEWAINNGSFIDEWASNCAASGGNINILVWMKEKGYLNSNNICVYAAENGQLEILKWAYEQGYAIEIEKCMQLAKKYPEIVDWIKQKHAT